MSEASRTMPDGSPPDVAQLTRRLADQRIGSLAQVFGVEALTWLALPPLWTEPLASSVGFPMAVQPLEKFLTLAADNGLVERDQPLRADPETGRAFWISESDRESVLAYLREHTSAGVPRLQTAAVSIAQRLLGTATAPLPDSVRYWAELALKADQPYEAARALGQNVAALTSEKRTGEAMARVDAGGSLARAIGGPLDSAVRLGNRRIEVAYRRASDQRHLRRYFQRIEQERVFEALLEPASPAWALHYLGMGGVGKTMLLRHITGQVAEARHLVVSRVDFDHLSPDYPVRRPGQLLLGLAVELRSFASSTHEEQLFDKIKDTTEELHEVLGAEPPAGHPLYNVRRREFDRILNAFCDLLRILPPPVVLILDTCEELARVPVVKRILPSVEATFDILTRVHAEIDTVRVIFAGRRPIASAGLGWSIPEAAPESGDTSIADPMRGLRQYLPPRKFLQVHEIRGLTEPEARDFLTRRWELRLDGALEKAILDRSVDLGRAAHVVIAGRRAVEDGGARYNPFDLALYAQWLRDDETLKETDITSGATDPYVDLRIVQRVRQPLLKEALPAIVALGRFDMAMLRGALPESLTIEQYADLYRELADYEWLDLQRDPKLGAFFLEVDRNLLPRMRRYFAQSDRESDTRLAGERLAPGLEALVRNTPLGDLSVNHLDAALSILTPPRAARLWAEVLLRVPAEADLSWLQNVTERLIGEDSAAHRQPGLAAGLVAASMIIGLHTDAPSADPAHTHQLATWPDADTGRWMTRFLQPLEISAPDADLDSACQPLADLIVSFEARPFEAPLNTTARPDTPERWLRRASEEEAGALLHAGDAIADRLQDRQSGLEPSASASRLAEVVVAWAEVIAEHKYPLGLVTMAQALAARLASVAGTVEKARALGVRALAGADALLDDGGQRLWLFWRSPASLVDRVRLEMLSLHGALGLVDSSDAAASTGYERSGPDVTKWLAGALSRNETIDGERLASAVELWLLEREVPEPTELGISEVAERYHVERQAAAAVHRRVPPLLVTLAMKRAALGQFDRAEKMLRERCREAEATRRDAETVRIATLARVDLACRSRHVPGDLASAVAGLSRGVRASSSSTRVYALRALTGTDVTSDFTPRWHDDWRTSLFPAKEESRVLALRKQGIRVQRGPESLPLPLRDALDGVECARVAGRHGLDAQGVLFPNGTTAVDSIEDLVRAMLRLYALDPIPEDQLSSAVRVPKTLRAFLPFSLRFSAPPGMTAPASFVQLAERAHMVAIVGDAAKPGDEPSSPVERYARRLLDHVGWRRWAELAQDEGELLALRLPDSAARLLEFSARLSARHQDHVAVIEAAATARLAASRAGLRDVVRSLATPLQQAWQTVSSANDSVWIWSAVETEARRLPDVEKAGKAVEDVPDTVGAWEGWACRVVASVAIERAMDDNAEHSGVRGVLLRYPGQAASPELSLSLESEPAAPALKASRLESAPVPARASNARILGPASEGLIAGVVLGLAALWVYLITVNAFGATGDPTPASARFLLPVLGVSAIAVVAVIFFVGRDLAGAVAGLLLFFGFLSLFYWLIGLAADVVLPVHLGRLGRTGALFAVLLAVGALPVSYRAVKRWWQSRVALLSQATVWMSALSSGGDLREQVAETQTVFLQMSCLKATVGSPLPVPVLRDLSPWSASVETPGLRPYAAAAAAIDPAALKPFAEIRTELHGRMWPVAMRVDTGWHFVPWEGLLSLATTQTPAPAPPPQSAPFLREPLFFYRWGRATGSASSPSAWSSGPVVLMGSWAVGEDSAWRSANRPLSHTRTAGDGSTPTIVHAIGTAVVTSAGRRLQLGDREFLDRQMLPPRLPLLVLQQATADSMARLGSDREQASLLRAVAGDMFEAGCQAIIVIPSLPPQLAERVTRTIVGSIASPESRVRATLNNLRVGREQDTSHRALRVLATAVRDARDEIFTWPGFENEPHAGGRADGRDEGTGRDAASQREVAWDLCLFARLPFDTSAPVDSERGRSE